MENIQFYDDFTFKELLNKHPEMDKKLSEHFIKFHRELNDILRTFKQEEEKMLGSVLLIRNLATLIFQLYEHQPAEAVLLISRDILDIQQFKREKLGNVPKKEPKGKEKANYIG